MGPAVLPNLPAGMPGQLCKPKTASQGNRSNSPSDHPLGRRAPPLRRAEKSIPPFRRNRARGEVPAGARPTAWPYGRRGRRRASCRGRTIYGPRPTPDRQRIHVGPQADPALAVSRAENAHDTGFAEPTMISKPHSVSFAATRSEVRCSS